MVSESLLDVYVKEWLEDEAFLAEARGVCIPGNYASALTRFGLGDHPKVERIHDLLLQGRREDGGWHCDPLPPRGTPNCWEAPAAFAALPKN